MNRLKRSLVWLRRLMHSRGFGIQSPADYRFVRYVINERWPYHVYDDVGTHDSSMRRKLGRLYLRLANERQPLTVIDRLGFMDYVCAGCRRARRVEQAAPVEMALLPIDCGYEPLFAQCNEQSLVVFQDIYRHPRLWHQIEHDERVTVTFDLYYCGIVLFDRRRSPHNYIVNF